MLTPVSPVSGSGPRGRRSGRLTANDSRDVVLQLKGHLAEAVSSLQQLQQRRWLDHR